MPEAVETWWARRQRSKAASIPYQVGQFRVDWERYPVLIRQYHPDLNHGITLTQVPPAADVYLVWQCDVGHAFVATPMEQRMRPGGSRRRSTWCPECARGAVPPKISQRKGDAAPRKVPTACGKSLASDHPVGDAFVSECAPRPASAAEPRLRQLLAERLVFDPTPNAVRVPRLFFRHLEVWPDIVLAELRVAIEYDTTGRDGLEHVGKREELDRRKDRLLRAAGWEVLRIRCGKLQPIGPYDLHAGGVTHKLVARILDRLGEIRGDLIVSSYLR